MSNITRLIINGFALVTAMHCGIAASGEAATITTSEQSGLRIDAQLKRFYSRVPAHHVPSGVLLEAGAIMKRDLILNNSESRQEKMAQNAFNDSYQELMKGHVFSDEKPLNLYSIGKKFTPDSVYPISLAFIDYDSIKNPKSIKSDSEGSYYKPTSRSRRTETKRFIATTVQAHLVYGTVVDFVLPQDLLLFNADTNVDIENLRFKFNDKIHEITLGEKFTINLGDEKSEPKKELTKGKISFGKGPVKEDPNTDENTGGPKPIGVTQERTYELFFTVDGREYRAEGIFKSDSYTPVYASGTTNESRSALPTCYDINPIRASHSYLGQKGAVNVRVYPANGTVTGSISDGTACRKGGSPKLNQIMVLVDGFDIENNRTQDDIYVDFGSVIDSFLQSGFDLVVVDYQKGQDYIQRNGLAIRELLVRSIPTWFSTTADERVVLMAGSMGTQTSRYGMRTAELAGEDHNVDLWLAIDGPFKGANIPIGIQAFVEFFSFNSSVAETLEGLNSPAASQQLLRNRYYDQSDAPYADVSSNKWYLPRQEHTDYYEEVNALGLPVNSRNIGIASGSGTGTPMSEPIDEQRIFNGVSWSAFFDVFNVRSTASSDHNSSADNGSAYNGYISLPVYCIFNSNPCFADFDLALTDAKRLDIGPGGYAGTPAEITALWNDANSGTVGVMSTDLYRHSFVPTFSALNIGEHDSFYNAANDTSALARSGFDRIWYEKCNAEHVQQTEGMWKVVTSEISAFLQHSPPVLSPLPEEACGVSEPFFEVSDVPWMSNLWHDGRGSNYLEWGPRSGSVHHADYYEIYSGPEPDPESITPVLWKTTTGRSGYYTAYHENYLYIRGCNENGCSALSYGVPVWPQG